MWFIFIQLKDLREQYSQLNRHFGLDNETQVIHRQFSDGTVNTSFHYGIHNVTCVDAISPPIITNRGTWEDRVRYSRRPLTT